MIAAQIAKVSFIYVCLVMALAIAMYFGSAIGIWVVFAITVALTIYELI